jgi:hypothetical protein
LLLAHHREYITNRGSIVAEQAFQFNQKAIKKPKNIENFKKV